MRGSYSLLPPERSRFPFLFGGTFIEGQCSRTSPETTARAFPFLFGGTFIEGDTLFGDLEAAGWQFPFLFGGTFIEGKNKSSQLPLSPAFPFLFGGTFIEGSARVSVPHCAPLISLPFRRDFH